MICFKLFPLKPIDFPKDWRCSLLWSISNSPFSGCLSKISENGLQMSLNDWFSSAVNEFHRFGVCSRLFILKSIWVQSDCFLLSNNVLPAFSAGYTATKDKLLLLTLGESWEVAGWANSLETVSLLLLQLLSSN